MQFSDLGLCSELLTAVAANGYKTPSPIQARGIPAVLSGKDVMGAAQTGTGKTAGFTLPMLQRLNNGNKVRPNQVRALVLTPTRELAAQVGESVTSYGKNLPLRSTVIYGGVSANPQMQAMRRGVDILIATPGRLLDLHQQNAVKFDQLEILVLDEADRMLDMGFIRDIKKILKLLPPKRQNLLYSATFSDEIRSLAKGLVNDPVEIDVAPRNSTVERVKQAIYPVVKSQKTRLLIHLIQQGDWHQVLVFSRTKHGANRLAQQLTKSGINASAIHGNKSQGARTKALADFKSNRIQVLVATDIAARGIDIDLLPHVVNLDLPNVAEDYVHRIGRTGRAGADGEAVSLVCEEEIDQLRAIERLTNQSIPRIAVDGFEAPSLAPTQPNSKMSARKPPRPKKPKSSNGNQQRQTETAKSSSNSSDGDSKPARRRRRPRRRPATASGNV